MDERFNKWNKWLDIICSEIGDLSLNKYIFWEVQDIIKNNPKIQKPSVFYDFLANAYVALALMGVRRQVKIDKDSISLARLLEEICDTPKVLLRRGGNYVDPALIKSDLKKLQAKAQKCEKYADRRIAHFDKREPKGIPRFDELDDCVDFLEELMKRYYLLFRGESLLIKMNHLCRISLSLRYDPGNIMETKPRTSGCNHTKSFSEQGFDLSQVGELASKETQSLRDRKVLRPQRYPNFDDLRLPGCGGFEKVNQIGDFKKRKTVNIFCAIKWG